MIDTAAWNTRCLYSPDGQRIGVAKVNAGGKPTFAFADADRHIDGIMEGIEPSDITDIPRIVSYLYDNNKYRFAVTDTASR